VCLEETSLAYISAEEYNKSISKIEKKKREKIEEFFEDMPYFKSL
jgi:hypothetical protein